MIGEQRRHSCHWLWLAAACASTGQLVPEFDAVLRVPPGAVHVVVCTSHECPIANAYAPTLRALADAWAGEPVRMFVVYADPDLTRDAAAEHAAEFALPGSLLLDPRHQLASHLGITRTPEAVVLSAAGLVYRGRIDDQWHGLGARSAAASQHDLADAVAAALVGRPPTHPRTAVVGCLLPEPRR